MLTIYCARITLQSLLSPQKMYDCPTCGKNFQTYKALHNHKRNHSDLIKCPNCDYKMPHSGNLKKHQKRHHSSNVSTPPRQSLREKFLLEEKNRRPTAQRTLSVSANTTAERPKRFHSVENGARTVQHVDDFHNPNLPYPSVFIII